jgi:hypothetical protein
MFYTFVFAILSSGALGQRSFVSLPERVRGQRSFI